jgi:SHS2 domain-containing protein
VIDADRIRFPDGSICEITDHTADIGIRVTAPDWSALLTAAAHGMLACIGDLKPAAGAPEQVVPFRLRASTRADLLRDWLAEILYHVDQRRWMLVAIRELAAAGDRIDASLAFAPYDPDASIMRRELKAVTYHQLSVVQTPDGLVATVIFDI